jgi:hypothetical protein
LRLRVLLERLERVKNEELRVDEDNHTFEPSKDQRPLLKSRHFKGITKAALREMKKHNKRLSKNRFFRNTFPLVCI